MIDKALLAELGWSEELISEVVRTAEAVEQSGLKNSIATSNHAGSMTGAVLCVDVNALTSSSGELLTLM